MKLQLSELVVDALWDEERSEVLQRFLASVMKAASALYPIRRTLV